VQTHCAASWCETGVGGEDDGCLRRGRARILERHGYRVLTAQTGTRPSCSSRNPASGGSHPHGHDDAEIRRRRPDHRVIQEIGPRRFLVASGYNASEATGDQGLPAAVPFIKKPWTLEEILGAVRKALDAPLSGAA